MQIFNNHFKVLEFEFNLNELENSTELITTTFCESEIYFNNKYSNNNEFDYGIRSRTLVTNKINNKKVLIYKSELMCKIIYSQEISSLLKIREFVEKTFSTHEKYFNENKPKELKISNINFQHEIDSFSLNIFSHLKSQDF
ncbi:hypothetical protein K8354_16145 [Polaribacter litorisediminis]|uniref:hypothetical protein n=1 Tax=Polaribacter litorisediminis TaxID=1908341 RepID=UPI001CBAA843|nr:hypothetical protein [Polaribacter litorisediminis]UAM97801.1 hypothetical protein K8354_16145 [Polaribacter litorisediminis]